MMQKLIANLPVEVNEEGYLVNFKEWNREIGLEIASDEEIGMTEEHWEVISWIQEQYLNEVALSIRKIGKSGVVGIKDFYRLFPKGPLKKASKIAGIPKPVSCI